jgi:hypothetical protein
MTPARRGGKPFNPVPPQRAIGIAQKRHSIPLISRMGGSGMMRSTRFRLPVGSYRSGRVRDPIGAEHPVPVATREGLPWIGQWHNPNAG